MTPLIGTSTEVPRNELLTKSARTSGFASLLIAFVLACFALSPAARAVLPAPGGGYPTGNTAAGDDALFSLTLGGNFNTAIGRDALYSNTTGGNNTASGAFALDSNTTAPNNTGIGFFALRNNTTGWQNTANGAFALKSNTTADNNTADRRARSRVRGTQGARCQELARPRPGMAGRLRGGGCGLGRLLLHPIHLAGRAGLLVRRGGIGLRHCEAARPEAMTPALAINKPAPATSRETGARTPG